MQVLYGHLVVLQVQIIYLSIPKFYRVFISTGMEFQNIEFIVYSFDWLLALFEFRESQSLIFNAIIDNDIPRKQFAEHYLR